MHKPVDIKTLYESAKESIDVFAPFGGKRPDLIKTGFGAVDRALGGVFPGTCGILGAYTGVGKSSLIITSALSSNVPVGIISTEDTADVVGTRILSAYSGVDSLDIRKGSLTDAEKTSLRDTYESLKTNNRVWVAYVVGGGLESILEATHALADKGCKLIWLDYIQKIRGHNDDRRNEVATSYTMFQNACFQHGVSGMVVSQIARQMGGNTGKPSRSMLKESGDLENEARLILLAWPDGQDKSKISVVIDKSTVGGEGVTFSYWRDSSGTLREIDRRHEEEL